MAKQEEIRKEEGAKVSPNQGKYVDVKFTGIGTWTLDYKSKGVEVLIQGTTKRLNITDKEDLHHLLHIIKHMNSRANLSTFMDKNNPEGKTTQYRNRFTIDKLTGGLDNLPPVLRTLQHTISNVPTDEVRDAILSLVPGYFDTVPAGRNMPA